MLKDVLGIMSTFTLAGGGIWLLWGAVVMGVGLRDHTGPTIQSGVWQIIGGGVILAASALFKTIVIP